MPVLNSGTIKTTNEVDDDSNLQSKFKKRLNFDLRNHQDFPTNPIHTYCNIKASKLLKVFRKNKMKKL